MLWCHHSPQLWTRSSRPGPPLANLFQSYQPSQRPGVARSPARLLMLGGHSDCQEALKMELKKREVATDSRWEMKTTAATWTATVSTMENLETENWSAQVL